MNGQSAWPKAAMDTSFSDLSPLHILLLPLLGAAVGAIGSLLGLGGGFILVPILIFLYPEASPAAITSLSLTVVFLNALSATTSNVVSRRVDLKTAGLLAAGALPASVVGSLAAAQISKEHFQLAFGIMLLVGAAYTLWRSGKMWVDACADHQPNREIKEKKGLIYRFYVNTLLAGIISPLAGFISSFFGIGGGVVHMPALVYILKVPPRIAGATCLLVLVPTSLAGILTRLATSGYEGGLSKAALLGVGAILGGQLGVILARRVKQELVMRLLSLGLVAVGLRQILTG